MPQPRQARNGRSNNRGAPSSRSKRAAILETATELFGREGYEDSKWADVAESVGIGSTAVYDDFESGLADTIEWYQAHEDWWRPKKDRTEASYAAKGQ